MRAINSTRGAISPREADRSWRHIFPRSRGYIRPVRLRQVYPLDAFGRDAAMVKECPVSRVTPVQTALRNCTGDADLSNCSKFFGGAKLETAPRRTRTFVARQM